MALAVEFHAEVIQELPGAGQENGGGVHAKIFYFFDSTLRH